MRAQNRSAPTAAVVDQDRRLTEAARALGPKYRLVLDFGTFEEAPMRPSFTRHTPPRFPRPSF